ncbi:antitoxin [Nocardioides rotundus]|uniref:antitoxin n=1 Tax=Nocardioides rotundus TaxID=1774216 RepID=UPI001CC0A7CF|nr:antitoxin [Nocardioides rotundus]UAL29750.1 antitoxin [Nocardioides rotundus]
MPKFRKFAAVSAAAAAAKRYARNNPEKTDRYLGQAAAFADKRTKGKYSRQIDGLSRKAREAAMREPRRRW